MEQTEKKGTRHLIQCHCILPQYRGKKDPVFHQFIVFSVLDESDTIVPKYVQCNSCSAVHKVYDICKSEIMVGRDELRSVATIDDVRLGMNKDVQYILDTYSCDLSTWEQTRFAIDNQVWDSTIVITKDELEDETQGKILRIISETSFKIESFVRSNSIEKS